MVAKRMVVRDLGRASYDDAYAEQVRAHARVVALRESQHEVVGEILLVEHDPVITVTRRAREAGHVLATEDALAAMGVALRDTDRGGDVTYHGPGQIVAYPIVDLERLGLGLHAYMRGLEGAVIATLARFGVVGVRDEGGATGVWVAGGGELAKVCAMGVRLRKWVSMHGLALNVSPRMEHFGLIVPCGLVGRPVTSMERLLGARCPTVGEVRGALVASLAAEFGAAAE